MSFFRNVHISMWGDRKVRGLSDTGRILWFFLLTAPQSTQVPGCIPIGKASVAENLGWPEARVIDGFAELAKAKMAYADFEACFVWLPNAPKYAPGGSFKNVIGWMAHIDILPECDLKDRAIGGLWRYVRTKDDRTMAPFIKRFGKAYLAKVAALLDAPSDRASDAPSHPPSDRPSDAPCDAPSDGPPMPDGMEKREREIRETPFSSNSADAEPDLGEPPDDGWPGPEDEPPRELEPDAGDPDHEPPSGGRGRFGPDELIGLWNAKAHPVMPRVKRPAPSFREQLRRRLREHPDPAFWEQVIDAANASPLCRGEAKPQRGANKSWVCTLKFLAHNDANALNVLDGDYGDDRRRDDAPARRAPAEDGYRYVFDDEEFAQP